MAPVEIDGNPITGATIDGTDVQEITVDGQTVFSAQTLPVAASDLKAWHPFDASFYGGNNGDDVTATFLSQIASDTTDYSFLNTADGPVTYLNSGGINDINAGPNSGAFESGGGRFKRNGFSWSGDTTLCAWVKDLTNGNSIQVYGFYGLGSTRFMSIAINRVNPGIQFVLDDGVNSYSAIISHNPANLSNFNHAAIRYESSTGLCTLFVNGQDVGDSSEASGLNFNPSDFYGIGSINQSNGQIVVDDCRFYESALTNAQINQIYQNTKP